MVDVKRKPKESISMMMRRFSQRVRESGILMNAKKSRFKEKKISKGERRKVAVEREKRRKERQKLKKWEDYNYAERKNQRIFKKSSARER